MISVDEFRESYINEDINAQAVNTSRYPIEVFIENAVDILQNDYLLVGGMEQCYYEYSRGSKSMRIDAAYLDLPANTLNLLYADYNSGAVKSITNTFISAKSRLLLNFLVNSLKGHFANAELSDPAVQLARNIKANFDYIGKIHLFIISTDKLSSTVKKLSVEPLSWNGRTVEVVLDVLDIEKIYRSKWLDLRKKTLLSAAKTMESMVFRASKLISIPNSMIPTLRLFPANFYRIFIKNIVPRSLSQMSDHF